MFATKIDYFKTFYASDSGRKVLASIDDYARGIVVRTPETAVGKCMLLDLVEHIKTQAGFVYGVESIAAESGIAAQHQMDKEPEKKKDSLL